MDPRNGFDQAMIDAIREILGFDPLYRLRDTTTQPKVFEVGSIVRFALVNGCYQTRAKRAK